jgi:PGF-pre-PGF domain-containing protein
MSQSVVVNVDRTAPTVAFVTPSVPNTSIKGQYNVTVQVVDAIAGVTSVKIRNGTAGAWVNASLASGNAANGTWSAVINTVGLTDGVQTLAVNATDGATNSNTSVTLGVIADNTPPSIALISPANGFNSSNATQLLYFNATDALQSTLSCNGSVNGVSTGTFTNVPSGSIQYFNYDVSPFGIGTYYWNITCNDKVIDNMGGPLNSNTSETRTFNFDNESIVIYSVGVNQSDIFYSNASGNNVLTLIINASDVGPAGIKYITANFSALNQPNITLVNMTSFAPSMWNATIAITNVSAYNFVPLNVTIFGQDNFNNSGMTGAPGFTTVVLYNMTTPPTGGPCMIWDTDATTDLSKETNFNSVNYLLAPKINISCYMPAIGSMPGAPAWLSQYTRLGLVNFTSLNMTAPDIGTQLAALPMNMNVSITPPGQFGDSRIYFNTSALTSFGSNATITMYHLPFSSAPVILADNATGYNSTVSWDQGVGEGNLTFIVNHFSGYNISDNVIPIITFNSPASGAVLSDTTPFINVTLNGTKTQITQATFTFVGATNLTYVYTTANGSVTANNASCSNVTQGSEKFTCLFNTSVLSGGTYNLTVTALDFGGVSGNSGTNSTLFTIDMTGPTFVNLSGKSVAYNTTLNHTIIASDPSGVSCYTVNDTTNFNINCSGYLTNNTLLAVGSYPINITANDTVNNANSAVVTIVVYNTSTQTSVNSTTATVTVTANVTEIVADASSTNLSQIVVPSNISSSTPVVLNFAALETAGNVTLGTNNVTLVRESTVNYTAVIPNGTVISGASGWDGKIQVPIVNTSTFTAPSNTYGSGAASVVVDMGSNVELNFSQKVKIVIGGQAGKHAAWARGSATLTDISTVCNNADNPTNIDAVTTRECYVDSGSDLVIWTYHFTTFAAYTPAVTTTTTTTPHLGGELIPGSNAPSIASIFSSVAADSTITIPISNTAFATTGISINVKNAATSVKIEVTSVTPAAGTPALTAVAQGDAYSYLNITTTNLPNDNIKSAKINFTVPKTWLSNKSYTTSGVSLYRLTTNWEKLTTRLLSENTSDAYYEADTPGFSMFAVFASTAAVTNVTQVCTPDSKRCSGNDLLTCIAGTAWQTTETCAYGCNTTTLACSAAPVTAPVTPPTTPPAAPSAPTIPLAAIVAVIVIIFIGGFIYYELFMPHRYQYTHK